jgi:hypothetical protein
MDHLTGFEDFSQFIHYFYRKKVNWSKSNVVDFHNYEAIMEINQKYKNMPIELIIKMVINQHMLSSIIKQIVSSNTICNTNILGQRVSYLKKKFKNISSLKRNNMTYSSADLILEEVMFAQVNSTSSYTESFMEKINYKIHNFDICTQYLTLLDILIYFNIYKYSFNSANKFEVNTSIDIIDKKLNTLDNHMEERSSNTTNIDTYDNDANEVLNTNGSNDTNVNVNVNANVNANDTNINDDKPIYLFSHTEKTDELLASDCLLHKTKGLLVDKLKKKVIACSNWAPLDLVKLTKEQRKTIFNYITSGAYSIFEDIDGTMIRFAYINNNWQMMTTNQPDASVVSWAEQKTFAQLFIETLKYYNIDYYDLLNEMYNYPNATWIFKMSHPHNKIVLDQHEPKLNFIGVYNNRSLNKIHININEYRILHKFQQKKMNISINKQQITNYINTCRNPLIIETSNRKYRIEPKFYTNENKKKLDEQKRNINNK